jgi:hypothetical protein
MPEYENLHTQRDLTMETILSVVERDSHVSYWLPCYDTISCGCCNSFGGDFELYVM